MSGALIQLAFIGPGGPEILVVMLVLLLMFGSKDAPRMLRKLNDMLNQFRSTAEHFKREVMYGDLDGISKPHLAADECDDMEANPDGAEGEDVDVQKP